MKFTMRFLAALALYMTALAILSPAHAAAGTTFASLYASSQGIRSFHGYVPSSYQQGIPMPLVVALHGCSRGSHHYEKRTGWSKLAEQQGFIVVYPAQSILANLNLCWNWSLSKNQHRGKGEPAIIAGITNYVRSHYTVDPSRIYVTGTSAGGVMANAMTVTYPDVYAASSIIAGCEYLCDPSTMKTPEESGEAALIEMNVRARAVPTILWQGTADTVVPPPTVDRIVGQWATIDGIDDIADATEYGQVPNGRNYVHQIYEDLAGNTLIERYLIDGAEHTYPGGCDCDPLVDPKGPNATGLSWEFFEEHPIP